MLEIFSMKTKHNPLMFECSVDKDLDGPYLVSSSNDFIWINRQFPGNFLRAATQTVNPQDMFRGVVMECKRKSLEMGWGSCLSYSGNLNRQLGVLIDYLNYFSFTEFDVYTDLDLQVPNATLHNIDWLPKGYVVITPKDKRFVGTMYRFPKNLNGVVVHNPSRSLCVLYPSESVACE